MAIRVTAFQPDHIHQMRVQPRQANWSDFAPPGALEWMAGQPSITVHDGDEVLMCGGIIQVWTGRKVCWAWFAEGIRGRMPSVVRMARAFLDAHPAPRIEMDTEADHAEGHRLAKVLGFELETARAQRYHPNGGDASIYVRIAA